jgi:hypothetical protein
MRVLGFKCIQGISGYGGCIELNRHVPTWWNNEVQGLDWPEFMFHGTRNHAHNSIVEAGAIKAASLLKGPRGKQQCFFALQDPLIRIHGGRHRQHAKVTIDNRYAPYPFGVKFGFHKGCTETVQVYSAWRAAALGAYIGVSPVHCALVHNSLSTKLMTNYYDGFSGRNYTNKYAWTDAEFVEIFNKLIDRPYGPPVVPRLLRMRYPWLFEKLDRYEHSLLVPQPKKMPRALRKTLTQEAENKPEVETIVIESDSEWGEWDQNTDGDLGNGCFGS